MDKEQKDFSNIVSLGLQQIGMLIVEYSIAQARQSGEINDEQYSTFREVSDKNWDKWSRKANRINRKVNRINRKG